nr:ribonuclease H-like domain-containing protein [Tanacetum cinerariifolium]
MAGEDTSQPPPQPIASTEASHMVSSVKLPILKKIQMTKDKAGNEVKVPPVTAQQILSRTRERKAKSTMLMAILDEHLARLYRIKDAKTLWVAIKTRFGEGLDKGYDRFQRLLSLLEIHGAGVPTEDANQKFLRSLPSAWSNISLITRNKPGIDNLDIDDLYNNLKVYEADIKASSGSSSNSQIVVFVFAKSTSIINELNTAYSVSTATCHSSQAQGSSTYADELIGRDNGKRPVKEEDEKAMVVHDGLGTYDWSYQVEEEATDIALMAFTSNPSSSSSLNSKREKLRKANLEIVVYQYGLESIEGQLRVHQQNEVIYEEKIGVLEYDVKDKSNLLKYTQKQLDETLREKEYLKAKLKKFETSSKNLTKLLDSQISEKVKTGLDDSIYKFKISKTVTSLTKDDKDAPETSTACVEMPKENRSNAPLIQDWDTDSDNDSVFRPKHIPTKIDFVKAGESVKHVKLVKSVKPVKPVKTAEQTEKSKNFSSSPKIEWLKKSVLPNNVGKRNGHKESRPVWNNVQRINHQNKFAPTAVFTTSERIPVSAAKPKVAASTSAAKPVNTAGPKQSHIHEEIQLKELILLGQKQLVLLNEMGLLLLRPQQGYPQQALKNKEIVDSGCSRHMTGNKAYLVDYQEINDGGFVAFGSSRCKITGKDKIRTEKLDFDDVSFVNELQFNLFFVSQIFDKKNRVLFTEIECLVLSPNFKLLDESQVLLRIPKQSNMYSFDLQNVVPSGDLTSLFAKAFIDESNLWHRRLGYVNFKNMNKLVKGNLVRGIKREYSNARTSQQNEVAERKNRTLIEAARTMLADSLLPIIFWVQAVNIACYVLNRALVTKSHNKTPYELLNGRTPRLDFMRPFGCPVTILNM